MKINVLTLNILLLLIFGCTDPEHSPSTEITSPPAKFESPPEWSKEVVWYEIGVERFRNGDPSNDPTAEDIVGSYPGFVPEGWAVTPWTHDWYKDDTYVANIGSQLDVNGNKIERFVDKAQMRRYGGDLQGVLDKLDYLDSLGITAIYFRPLNDAPSLHKYDARNWRHIDRNFGPDPAGDLAAMNAETPDDPGTWIFTEADQLFLKVIEQCHRRNIRLILDYSWNHTGLTFWAWRDLREKQAASKFADWYWIESFDKPETPEDEFAYHGWVGVPTLPEIRETQKQDLSHSLQAFEGNVYSDAAKQHIFNVTKRWLDPDGDGDPSDGVDGYRLDVAAEMPLDFWREYRKQVRQINPEAYLLGEIWWEAWPDKLLDPEPYLRGDIFDAVMNYRWYRSARHYFNASPDPIATSTFIDSLNRFRSNISSGNNYAMMNYTGGYDTPRILTSLFNKNKYKYQTKVHENPAYKIHQPDAATFQTLRLLLLQQYTYVGAPHIYAGDEMGMWGADDPSSRKPLIWKDYAFEAEMAHPLGLDRPIDQVRFNEDLFQYYRRLIRMRAENPVLIHGDIEFLDLPQTEGVLAYRRFTEDEEIIVVLNTQENSQMITLPIATERGFQELLSGQHFVVTEENVSVLVGGRDGVVLRRGG